MRLVVCGVAGARMCCARARARVGEAVCGRAGQVAAGRGGGIRWRQGRAGGGRGGQVAAGEGVARAHGLAGSR
eukprot:scaffold155087_cov32-Tisochrysis_lutea.AAC.2